MSEMKLIMENWRRFEKESEMIILANSPEINESPVFLFEGKSKKHFKTMTFGNLFENLEKKKITFDRAMRIWEKSTLYEIEKASKKDKEVLKELFGKKRGWEKEASAQAKEAGEKDPTKKTSGLKYKALVLGTRMATELIGKGFRFLTYAKKQMAQSAVDISNVFNTRGWEKEAKEQAKKSGETDPTKVGQTLARNGALKIGKIITPAAKILKKVISTIFKLVKGLLSKFSSVMGNPYVKLGMISLCLVMSSLSLWFPAFVVVVPFALRRIAFSAAGEAVKRGVSMAGDKARQMAADAKAMAESMERRLLEVVEGIGLTKDLKDISNIIGQAILNMAEEIGSQTATFSVEDLAYQTSENGESLGAFQTVIVKSASVADEQVKIGLDAIQTAKMISEKMDAAENSKEALKALKILEKASPDDQAIQTLKKAIQMAGKLCEVDDNFCASSAQLAKDVNIATDYDGFSQIDQWGHQMVRSVDGDIVDSSSSDGAVSYSKSTNTSYITGAPGNELPES